MMNNYSQKYWDDFWTGKEQPGSVCDWQFGFDPDGLAQLVIQGKKTATTSGYIFYELENEPLPITGLYNIILDGNDMPVAITRNVDVQIMPMNMVTEVHAQAEGEGDLSFEYWWNVHREFFTKELATLNMDFSDDMLVVCERFELVDVYNQTS